jgi:ribonuclease HI
VAAAVVNIDGASRGNPGPAAWAAVVVPEGGAAPLERSAVIPDTTNNVAEYTALLEALDYCAALGLTELQIRSDSELLVKQMRGEYRVKHPDLQDLYREAQHLLKPFAKVSFEHVRREQNKRADELCNLVLDAGKKSQPKAAAKPAGPKKSVTDATVRADAITCLEAAAAAWRTGDTRLGAAQVWDQLWSVLEDGGVLKKA